jgi:DHA1 family bicyclomycin/chloramphenicol resistance-like MFS transporter
MNTNVTPRLSVGEFVSLMAILTSLLALSIDAMLPALPDIGTDLAVENPNNTQLIVSSMFFGFAAGQILFGPLSDSFGRKPIVYMGLSLFIVGDVISIMSSDFTTMLIGRVLQGIGVAGPRVVSIALVRDQFEGRAMARIMSLIMMVFIAVPALAPALGQSILYIAPWRYIFGFILSLAVIAFVWFAIRQPETLPSAKRVRFSLRYVFSGICETCANRTAFGYTVTAGLVLGAFIGYLSSAQQIFQDKYDLGDLFPYYFGALALAIGAASYSNARLVQRLGMRVLTWRALQVLCAISTLFAILSYQSNGNISLWAFMIWGVISFYAIGFLFGNFNALAMEPLGHIAGTGAAVIGSFTTFISLAFGVYIGQMFDGTALPLFSGFATLAAASIATMYWIEKGVIKS